MTCPHVIRDGSLICTRTDRHDPQAAGGHVYQSTSGIAQCPKEE